MHVIKPNVYCRQCGNSRTYIKLAILGGAFFILFGIIHNSGSYMNRTSDDLASLNVPVYRDVVRASDVRTARDTPAGPFLGTGHVPQHFLNMSLLEAQRRFHSGVVHLDYKCTRLERMGNKGDGGYDVCYDSSFVPHRHDCLVYSFGIRNEWSFDDAIHAKFNCSVHSFDPSMTQGDHVHKEPNMYFHKLGIWGSNLRNKDGWELRDLTTIMEKLKHEERVIDYLKIDVEGAEWPLVTNIVKSGVHKYIKQMALELHTPRFNVDNQEMDVVDYGEIDHALRELERVGFRKFQRHMNNGCCGRFVTLTPQIVAKPKGRLCCYETFYVNSRFLQNDEPQ